ncbi:MAG: 3-deoxy-D-manno-octulosonic acid transferase [Verrucomicrobia subdivision 3 bacterium]|nr:3-deoxy-D-manno-octulosonic acid transferase [Limisphaerales bacterium]MCS1415152.1 3-deoxy-D-manno-octulosonic acid transferase [Limisphaerales bacterium]
MRFLYNTVFTVFFLLLLPYYGLRLWRRSNWKSGFGQRFGFYSKTVVEHLRGNRVIWFHAVSVGEVNLCALLVKRLGERFGGWAIVVSTTTTTGMGELQRKLPEEIVKVYYPIDFSLSVNRALRVIHPEIVVLVEAEIWPNLLWRLADQKIPCFLINARLSDRSAKRYQEFSALFQSVFSTFAGVGVQDEQDAKTLELVGCRPDSVRVTGNLKFDAVDLPTAHAIDSRALVRWAGAKENAIILLGSSTHAGEERWFGEIFLRLRHRFEDLFLVMVPRHFERAAAVARELGALRIKTRLRSRFGAEPAAAFGAGDCLIVDSTGELCFFYNLASVVVIGKSFLAHGGQNPIEAASVGCPIVTGPFMENFRVIMKMFLDKDGLVQVENVDDLESTLAELLSDRGRRSDLGRRAQAVVDENRGGIERSIAMIEPYLRDAS